MKHGNKNQKPEHLLRFLSRHDAKQQLDCVFGFHKKLRSFEIKVSPYTKLHLPIALK